MEEPKTLKDLRVLQKFKAVPHPTKIHGISLDGSGPSTHIHQSHVDLWNLKQEVIKQIEQETNLAVKSEENREFLMGRISFAKEFFNITEEDLKNARTKSN